MRRESKGVDDVPGIYEDQWPLDSSTPESPWTIGGLRSGSWSLMDEASGWYRFVGSGDEGTGRKSSKVGGSEPVAACTSRGEVTLAANPICWWMRVLSSKQRTARRPWARLRAT